MFSFSPSRTDFTAWVTLSDKRGAEGNAVIVVRIVIVVVAVAVDVVEVVIVVRAPQPPPIGNEKINRT